MTKEPARRVVRLALAAAVAGILVVVGAVGTANAEIALLSLGGLNVALAVGTLLYRAAYCAAPSPTAFEPNMHFSTRATLVVMALCCVFFAAIRGHDAKFAVLFLLWTLSMALLCAALRGQRAGCMAILAYNVSLSAFLFTGPIASYHINGRAWYDYGVSRWNPPLSVDEDGTLWRGDYDPKFTPPVSWPIIGGVFDAMCFYSIGIVVCPPIAPLTALASGILLLRYRLFYTRRQRRLAFALWAAALCPLLYLIVWGENVLSWIAD